MRKLISVMLTATVLLCMFAITAGAEESTEIYTYTVYAGNATITGIDNKSLLNNAEVVVPSEIDGYNVTTIGDNVFSGCNNIVSVVIPDSVETIGNHAFSYSSIEKILLGDNIKTIGSQAFYQSYHLSEIYIPASVESIGDLAFGYCGMTNITVAPENNFYSSDEYGVLFNKDKTELIKYTSYNERTSYIIPESVESIDRFAFMNSRYITKIAMSDNVTVIGADAFMACSALTDINLSNNLSLLGDEAFWGCISLESILIPSSVIYFGTRAFGLCTKLSSVIISEGITEIGISAFLRCESLNSIDLSESVTEIGNGAFSYTGYFNNKDNWKNNVLYLDGFLLNADIEKICGVCDIEEGTRVICAGVFEGCLELTGVTVPDTVERIENKAFYNCEKLSEISLSDSITSIGADVFEKTAYFNDSSNWENNTLYIGNHLISVSKVCKGDFFIKNGTIVVAESAFDDASSITSIAVPASVVSFANNTMSLSKIVVDAENKFYASDENGVLFNKEMTELILFPANADVTEYIVPDTVEIIPSGAFMCLNLKNLIIQHGIKEIESLAIISYGGLEYVHVPSSVKSIGSSGIVSLDSLIICSDSQDSIVKDFADENGYSFEVCDNHGLKMPEEPNISDEPDTPTGPVIDERVIPTPSTTTINYGDAIILHVNVDKIPDGGYVVWRASNNNFTIEPSYDGKTCTIYSSKSGITNITATIYDADGNAVSTDTQKMTSKAGFFDKIIAFFKSIFGLSKVFTQAILK